MKNSLVIGIAALIAAALQTTPSHAVVFDSFDDNQVTAVTLPTASSSDTSGVIGGTFTYKRTLALSNVTGTSGKTVILAALLGDLTYLVDNMSGNAATIEASYAASGGAWDFSSRKFLYFEDLEYDFSPSASESLPFSVTLSDGTNTAMTGYAVPSAGGPYTINFLLSVFTGVDLSAVTELSFKSSIPAHAIGTSVSLPEIGLAETTPHTGAIGGLPGVIVVPEPSSWALMAIGLVVTGGFGWRRQRQVV